MIKPVSQELNTQLQEKIDFKTKPIGALGTLETIAKQVGAIQNTLTPKITEPTIVVFAGDHGIVKNKPVSPYPQEVTQQMVLNFLSGGAAINVFCKQNNLNLHIVDAGVNGEFEKSDILLDYKIAMGTKDYSQEPAMSTIEVNNALEEGRAIVKKLHQEGTNVIGFGEMGIGNTSAAALLMSYFTKTPIEACVGSGTGLDNKGIQQKATILREVYDKHIEKINTPQDALQRFGGFEIAMMCGAMLEAAALQMTLLIDGFIVTSALLTAYYIDKNIIEYCIFSHTSGEQGHKKMLSHLNTTPLLNLGMRLGEGSGVAVAFPIVKSAIAFLNEMATFKSASVSEASE